MNLDEIKRRGDAASRLQALQRYDAKKKASQCSSWEIRGSWHLGAHFTFNQYDDFQRLFDDCFRPRLLEALDEYEKKLIAIAGGES